MTEIGFYVISLIKRITMTADVKKKSLPPIFRGLSATVHIKNYKYKDIYKEDMDVNTQALSLEFSK